MIIVRYADDLVVGFEHEHDARHSVYARLLSKGPAHRGARNATK